MLLTAKTKVAVLRGGPSHGYDDSLKTGGYILSLLREMPEHYEPIDVFISRDGEWHHRGLVEDPHRILSRADVVWNSLHGTYGEDGQVQRLLENLQVPFTGSSAVASAISLNKELSKELYRRHNLLTPESALITEEDLSDEEIIFIFRKFVHPVIVKPTTGVRALGVRLAHTFHELKEAIKETFKHSPKVLIEEYISGTVSSCLVLEGGKGEVLYSFVPAELSHAKRPGRLSVADSQKIGEMSKTAHSALGLRHYSSSDFIVTPKGKIYILETNAVPVLHEQSLLHESIKHTGWRHKDFAHHCLQLALNKRL